MATLKYLDISLNRISSFTSNTFNGLKNIVILNLTYNNILFIDQYTFSRIASHVVVSDKGSFVAYQVHGQNVESKMIVFLIVIILFLI